MHTNLRAGATAIFATLIPLLAFAWAAGLSVRFGWLIYSEQFLVTILTLSLACAFLRTEHNSPLLRWIDSGLAMLSLGFGCVLAVRYPVLQAEAFFRPTEALTISVGILLLLAEASRRSNGRVLLIVFLFVFAYALFGNRFEGLFQAPQTSPVRVITYLGLDTGALLGMPLAIAAGVVVAFLAFGQFLQAAGGATFITDFARALMGRYRGGNSKIAIAASGLFGSISGSTVSNVVSTGSITIPLMVRSGHRPTSAGAIEATASTGGQLMPPVMGAAAFLMAETMGVSYQSVAIAALVPAILFYVAVFMQSDMEAARLNIAAVPRAERSTTLRVASRGLPVIAAFSLLIVLLFVYRMPAQLGAFITASAIAALSLVWVYGAPRGGLRTLAVATYRTGMNSVDIVLICAVAGLIIGLLQMTGLSFAITHVLLGFAGSFLLPMLLVVAVLCIILGMGMPSTAVYILVATMAAQPLIRLGIEPMAAHLFVFYFGMLSMITPPVAIAAFAAATIAESPPMRTAVAACRFGWPAFVLPILFVYSPGLLLIGDPQTVGWAVLTCTVGVIIVSYALGGYLSRPLTPVHRLVLFLAGVAALTPAPSHPDAWMINVGGMLLAVALWMYHRRRPVVQEEVSGG